MEKRSDYKVLVLGGSGLLGFHCAQVLSTFYDVIQTYNEHPVNEENSVHFSVSSNQDRLLEILTKYRPSALVNTVGFVTVDGCETNPMIAKNLNSSFVSDLVTSMQKIGLEESHLIQISTAGVYGNRNGEPKPWKETDITNPLSVYAETKLEGETNAITHNGPVSILRTDFYGINPLSEKSLLWWIIKHAVTGKVMQGWENIYFSPVSAWTLSLIIRQILQTKVEGVFNVGCKDTCNKYAFAEEVCKLIGIRGKVRKSKLLQDQKSIRPDYTVLNSSKLNSSVELDFSWKQDLKSYIKNMPAFPNTELVIKQDKIK